MGRRRWLRLQKWQVFLFFFLQISIKSRFLTTAETDGERFLQQKEQQVQEIAEKAVQNAGDTSCDLISSCTESNCSRAACHGLHSDTDSFECVDVATNVTTCGCNRFQANFRRSYVRVPLLSDSPNSITTESVVAICSQRGLDTLFQSFPKNGTFYNYYLGTVDGSFRVYPGNAEDRCDNYDPRSRPWYVGAISVIKDLVVLVDVSSSMGEDFGFFEKTTPLSSALNMTQLLLGTLTKGDRATVISYNASSSILVQPPFTVNEGTVNVSDSNFKALLNSVGDTTPDKVKGLSNITAGISAALSVLDSSSPDALKVILVFTDGVSSAPQSDLDSLAVQLNKATVTLFMYQINRMDTGLKNLSCSVTLGHNEQLIINPSKNPLYALKSYFSFLARDRKLAAPQQLSFWQPPYPDYGILGEVITVAYPVISPSGDLVGVAGIDVQVDGLSQLLQDEINTALKTRRTEPPPSSLMASFAACDAGSNNGSTPCDISSAVAVCPQTDKEHSLAQLLCCRGCGGLEPEGSKKHLTPLWICLGIVGAVAIVGLVFVLKRREGLPPPPPPPPGSKQPRIVPAPDLPARDSFL